MNNITIRPITEDDTDTLWHMLYYAAHMDEDEGKNVNDAKSDPFLKRYVENWGQPTDLGFIAEDNAQALGAVWIRQFDDEPHPELAIAVLPDAIGQGIGTQLIERIIDESKNKFPTIMLSVRADNPALRLYQRLGFQTVKEITNRIGTRSYEMHLTR